VKTKINFALTIFCLLSGSKFRLAAEEFQIVVGKNTYVEFRTDLTNGTPVFIDADPGAGSLVRATQRSLGYREMDYKSLLPGTLYFAAVTPKTNAGVVLYDYSSQTDKTNIVGYWANKDVPIMVGPDGYAYISDGHHTTAGYLAPSSPVREFIPGKKRVILGHITANFFDPVTGPVPVTDTWWRDRAAVNNALLIGPAGDLLILPGEPGYDSLQPILPSVLPMPTTPSALNSPGVTAMSRSIYRSLAWGLADAIVVSATDSGGKKVAGYKKSAPGSDLDINFVEFYWGDYLRDRVVWDDSLSGSPLGSANANANAVSAPLSFLTAAANGIALAKSESYQDRHGRNISAYTNAAIFPSNTVNWAQGSISNGLANSKQTYNMYLRDDSGIAGPIIPSAFSTNILHIDTASNLVVTQALQNFRSILVNAGGTLAISWKDATVSNSVMRMDAGTGAVTLAGRVDGGTISVENGTLVAIRDLNAQLAIKRGGVIVLDPGLGSFTAGGDVVLGGTADLKIKKSGAALTQEVIGSTTKITFDGVLTVTHTGDALAAGDRFRLFMAPEYAGYFFEGLNLPALPSDLAWDTSQLDLNGSIGVVSASANQAPIATLQGPGNLTLSAPARFDLIATATDPEGSLAEVKILDGTVLAGKSTTSPFTLELSNVTAGVHHYRAVVADHLGATNVSAEFSLNVTASNIPPTISLESLGPDRLFTAPATIAFNANVDDADGTIARVDYFRGTTKIGTVAKAPFILAVNNFPVGSWELKAVATDNNGATNQSEIVAIQVLRRSTPAPLTLQILHASDLKGGVEAIEDAVRFSQVLGALRAEFPTNTITVSSGNNYIPGAFFNASADPGASYNGVAGRGDISILNALGFEASAMGNDEFDDGTAQIKNLIQSDAAVTYPGALFPYLSANVDFTSDSNLSASVGIDGSEAALLTNRIARRTIIAVGRDTIGLVGATTPNLKQISSPGNVGVDTNLVAVVQGAVDALLAQGVNKIILLANLQQFTNEFALAQNLHDVDVVVAGGSEAIFAKTGTRLQAGDVAQADYPSSFTSKSGEPVLVVNTGPYYRYVGRLILQFDTNGIVTAVDPRSGPYPTDPVGVAAIGNFPAEPGVSTVVAKLAGILDAKDGVRFGRTTQYLNGYYASLRTEESNLGDVTADANLWAARLVDTNTTISLKNGGGIGDSIGAVVSIGGSVHHVPPLANPRVGKLAGEISQFDIENSLPFNNGLTLLTVTAQQLRDAFEWGVSATASGATPGQFPQASGAAFSFNPANAPMTYIRDSNNVPVAIANKGTRLRSLIVTNANGSLDLVVENGALVGNSNRLFRLVTIDFMANGGDGYFALTQGTSRLGLLPANAATRDIKTEGTEQKALADYLLATHVITLADTDISADTRIQNLSIRNDTIGSPLFSRIVPETGKVELFFSTLPGRTMHLESRNSLDLPWQDSGISITGDGFIQSVVDQSPSPSRFYRLVRQN
jgi:5'-nucleotidase/UDP-sugar diphosphatase